MIRRLLQAARASSPQPGLAARSREVAIETAANLRRPCQGLARSSAAVRLVAASNVQEVQEKWAA